MTRTTQQHVDQAVASVYNWVTLYLVSAVITSLVFGDLHGAALFGTAILGVNILRVMRIGRREITDSDD